MTIKELIEKVRQGNTTESDAIWLEQFVELQSIQRVRHPEVQHPAVDDWDLQYAAKLETTVKEMERAMNNGES